MEKQWFTTEDVEKEVVYGKDFWRRSWAFYRTSPDKWAVGMPVLLRGV